MVTDRVCDAAARLATRVAGVPCLLTVTLGLALGCRDDAPPPARHAEAQASRVTVTRPTVISYFVIPSGAVDTMPDLAVEADDWNVGMAALRESLDANGVDLAMVLDSVVSVHVVGRADTTLVLGPFKSSGYVFVRPNGPFCVRPGGADADSVMARARAYVRSERCT